MKAVPTVAGVLLAVLALIVSNPLRAQAAPSLPELQEATLASARDKLRRKEFPAALQLFGEAARAGSAEGQYQYAQMLRNAQGTRAGADLKGACHWLEQAAGQGHARAALAFAGLIDEGSCASTMTSTAWRDRAATEGVLPPPSTSTVERNDPVVRRVLAFRAALDGEPEVVQALLRQDAGLLQQRDEAGRTLLHVASDAGQSAVLEMLLSNGASLASSDQQGYTPLALAARKGSLPCVRVLLAAGAPLESVNLDGDTPLFVGIAAGHGAVVAALLEAGANRQHRNRLGDDARAFAARGSESAVRILFGLPPSNVRDIGQAPGIAKTGVYAGWSALQVAAEKGDIERVKVALASGAPVEARTPDGWTPLTLAARRGDLAMVDMLLRHGAAPSLASQSRWSPLALAVGGGHVTTVRRLLEAGADAAAPNPEGARPLQVAASMESPDLLAALLVARPPLDQRDEKGQTALIRAAGAGRFESVRLLLAAGAELRARDARGRSALWLAAARGDSGTLSLLFGSGGKTVALLADTEGSTPCMPPPARVMMPWSLACCCWESVRIPPVAPAIHPCTLLPVRDRSRWSSAC